MHFLPLALLLSAVVAFPTTTTTTTPRSNSTRLALVTKKVSNSTILSRVCGVGAPSPALKAAHSKIRKALHKRAPTTARKFIIDTVFHVVSTEDQKSTVTRAMVANQFGALQAAYASSSISFRLSSVDYTVNDTWATDENDADMKLALRKGGYSTLNIYFQTNLSTSYYGAKSQLLGYCTLPTNITYAPCDGCELVSFPKANYALDGCNVHAGSMPNGALQYYNQGKTAVHEVGHWFGLLHTFQGNTCDQSAHGDYIDDTPQEAVSTDGCPVGKKSCPDCPGVDPIHNFMDYSTDSCYESFSPQQVVRMQEMYSTLRLGL